MPPPIVSVYWLSSNQLIVSVEIDPHGVILHCSPVVVDQQFKGRRFDELIRWMQAQGGFQLELVSGDPLPPAFLE